jgi:hypothetical protein|tara:strand:- start:434 stop:583 length:150 start_codon:yes stop_codon:yes gene_type:complete
MCLLDAQLIFYPLAVFALTFFGIKIYKRYTLGKKNIEKTKPNKDIDSIS